MNKKIHLSGYFRKIKNFENIHNYDTFLEQFFPSLIYLDFTKEEFVKTIYNFYLYDKEQFKKTFNKFSYKIIRVNKKILNKFFKEFNLYSKKNYSFRKYLLLGYCKSEIKLIIKDLKEKTSITKENLIRKYGIKEGTKRFNEFRKKSRHTLETFIEKYGPTKGPKEFEKYKESKKKTYDLKYFISKYGDIKGLEKFKSHREKIKNTLETFIEKYGPMKGPKEFEKYKESKKKSSNYIHFITKHGPIKGYIKYINMMNKKVHQKGRIVSKESINFFNNLIKLLKINQLINDNDILYNKNEYKIIYNNRFKSFDFCIPKINLIIEYHGSLWHYNPNKLFKKRPFGLNDNKLLEKDKLKEKIAKDYGFDYYVIFDTDDKEEKLKYFLEIIKEKINENKIN